LNQTQEENPETIDRDALAYIRARKRVTDMKEAKKH
jgi:hypothetical protein